MEKPIKQAAPKKGRTASTTTPKRPAAKPRLAAVTPTQAPVAQPSGMDHDAIAARAYDLFERSGHPHGRDIEFWLAAERELSVRRKA